MTLSTVVYLYIEGKVIPTEFLVLPESKGNKTLLGLGFLDAAGIFLDIQGGKWVIPVKKQDCQKENFNRRRRKYYKPGDKVWVTIHPISRNNRSRKFMPKRIPHTHFEITRADFLAHFGLIVDLKQRKLIDTHTNFSSLGNLDRNHQLHIKTVSENSIYSDILKQFPDLTNPSIHNKIMKHDTVHVIETKGQPVHAKARRLRLEVYEQTKKEFEYIMEQGICRPSKSNWSSPLHVVNKKPNGIRPVGDYRALNAATIIDAYPIPHIQDFGQLLFSKTIFSKLDIARAYHHIPIHEDDIPKTAIITLFGLFEFPY
ncbi:retrovirus-related Pol polyprotein from transposon opus [Trichonephila clavipes]|nr:retrovirus-related Pol polyprotein from transposon opus [Trichonephila clavipes]